jgi:hypothetical protein
VSRVYRAQHVHSEDIIVEKLQSEARRQTGLTVLMHKAGAHLRGGNEVASAAGVAVGIPRAVRSDKVDLDFLYDWFHNQSPDVEPDKTTKFAYKRKRVFCAGRQRDLKCAKKVLTCSVGEAVEHCLDSDVFRSSGLTLHPKNVAACICPCIKAVKRHECVCPICNAFYEALTAYHRARFHWHGSDDPKCTGQCRLDCKNRNSEFRTFTRNYSTFGQKKEGNRAVSKRFLDDDGPEPKHRAFHLPSETRVAGGLPTRAGRLLEMASRIQNQKWPVFKSECPLRGRIRRRPFAL